MEAVGPVWESLPAVADAIDVLIWGQCTKIESPSSQNWPLYPILMRRVDIVTVGRVKIGVTPTSYLTNLSIRLKGDKLVTVTVGAQAFDIPKSANLYCGLNSGRCKYWGPFDKVITIPVKFYASSAITSTSINLCHLKWGHHIVPNVVDDLPVMTISYML